MNPLKKMQKRLNLWQKNLPKNLSRKSPPSLISTTLSPRKWALSQRALPFPRKPITKNKRQRRLLQLQQENPLRIWTSVVPADRKAIPPSKIPTRKPPKVISFTAEPAVRICTIPRNSAKTAVLHTRALTFPRNPLPQRARARLPLWCSGKSRSRSLTQFWAVLSA